MNKISGPLDAAISILGGVGALAEKIGIAPSAISNWRARGTIPAPTYCLAIERATNGVVTRRDLRPDDFHLIWPDLSDQAQPVAQEVEQ